VCVCVCVTQQYGMHIYVSKVFATMNYELVINASSDHITCISCLNETKWMDKSCTDMQIKSWVSLDSKQTQESNSRSNWSTTNRMFVISVGSLLVMVTV